MSNVTVTLTRGEVDALLLRLSDCRGARPAMYPQHRETAAPTLAHEDLLAAVAKLEAA